jgi:hypothetical protein
LLKSIAPPAGATIYVRLSTRSDPLAAPFVEKSAVMEWLKGLPSDPSVVDCWIVGDR